MEAMMSQHHPAASIEGYLRQDEPSDEVFYNRLKVSKPAADISMQSQESYKNIYPTLLKVSQKWWQTFQANDKVAWKVKISESDGIYIEPPQDLHHVTDPEPISVPTELNAETLKSMKVGWRSHPLETDPKYDIAEEIMSLLLSDPQLGGDNGCLERVKHEQVEVNLGLDDSYS
ncbi:hypothetical protein HDV05_000690 [Chytridiales sp. JEL 0842]|nr:hypothetical protein HDV05_000690 [Chytridiales sp. JEL 0842]